VGGAIRVAVVTGAAGRDFHDPAGDDLCLADALRALLPQRADAVTAVVNLVIACHEWNVSLSLERSVNLTM
jgi:hypothetical protein